MIDRRFFDALFGDSLGHLDLRALSVAPGVAPRQRFAACIDNAVTRLAAAEREEGTNLYVGIATRRDSSSGRKDNLDQIAAVWVDVDFTVDGDAEALNMRLDDFPLRPSMRVHSGGGEHIYWLFEEPVDVSTPEGVERVECVLKGLQLALDGDPNATDASRILRIPGSVNYPDEKKRSKGRSVAQCMISDLNETRYGLDDFEPWELRGRAARGNTAKSAESGTPVDLPERVRSVLESDRRAADRFMRDARGLSDTSASGVDLSLANALLRHATITREDCEAALRASRARSGDKAKDDQYFRRTLDLAIESTRKAEAVTGEDRAARFRRILRDARHARSPIVMLQYLGPELPRAARWPSTLAPWDAIAGGFYGVSMLAGHGGVGKSIVALGSALLAAAGGWTVAYMNAELPISTIRMRIARMMRGFGIAREQIERRLHIFGVHDGATLDDVVEWTCSLVEHDTKRVLVVLDSVNTLATYTVGSGSGDGAYFRELDGYLLWASEARRHSEGDLSFLLVSEINKQGTVKGGTSEYRPDVVMALKGSATIDDGVDVAVTKSRETRSMDETTFVLDFNHMALELEKPPAPATADDWRNA